MTLEITNGGGAQTLDIKQPDWQDEGYAVIGDVATPGSGPLAVTIGSGTLGAGNGALSVASGDALVGGATVSNGGVSVDIDSGDSEPRKDVVWIDSTGSVRVDKGTPTGILPQGASGFESYVPPVPFPGTTPATVLAAVFVPANADEIGSGDIQDRRLPADVVRSSLDATSLSTNGLDIAASDFVEQSNFYPIGLAQSISDGSTTSDTYASVSDFEIQLNSPLLSDGDADIAFAISGFANPNGDQVDIRLFEQFSRDVLVEGTAVDGGFTAGPSISAFDTGRLRVQIRNSDGATQVDVSRLGIFSGIQL